jgi:hypothetical protein
MTVIISTSIIACGCITYSFKYCVEIAEELRQEHYAYEIEHATRNIESINVTVNDMLTE